MNYLLLADAVMLLHVLIILTIVLPVPLIIAGHYRHWRWIRSRKLRLGHLILMAFVTVQTLLGRLCPLTLLENHFRHLAGQEGLGESFIAYWVHQLIYFSLPSWVFALVYLLFCGLIIGLYRWVPPVPRQPRLSGTL
jgi:hypothetical protein